MITSKKTSAHSRCSLCGHMWESETWVLLNVDERWDLVMQLGDGRLNAFTCIRCGAVTLLHLPVLFYVTGQHTPFVCSLPLASSESAAASSARQQQMYRWLEEFMRQGLPGVWEQIRQEGGLPMIPHDLLIPAISERSLAYFRAFLAERVTEIWIRRMLDADYGEERGVIEAHAELREATVFTVMEQMAQQSPDLAAALTYYSELLFRCHTIGIAQAFHEAGYQALAHARRFAISPQGHPSDNIEEALSWAKRGKGYLPLSHSREGWASACSALANIHFRRIKNDHAANVETAIWLGENILETLRPDECPDIRAGVHSNLGNFYANRVGGADVEAAFRHYYAAERHFQRGTYPDDWARLQLHIGHLYAKLGRDFFASDEVEAAIRRFHQALTVWTSENAPEFWARTKINLAGLHPRRHKGEPLKNSVEGVQHARAVVKTLPRKIYPLRWAQAQLAMASATLNRWRHPNSTGVYHMRINQLPPKRINQTLRHLRSALEEFTPDRWPSEHEMAQLRIGEICFALGRWREAHMAYAAALAVGRTTFDESRTDLGREDAVERQSDAHSNDSFCLYRLGRIEDALTQLECGKVRLLAGWLAGTSMLAPEAHPTATIIAPLITSAGGLVFVIRAGRSTITASDVIELPQLDERALNTILRGSPHGLMVNTEDGPTHGWWLLPGLRAEWPEQVRKATRELGERLIRPVVEHLRRLDLPLGSPLIILPNAGLGLLPLHAGSTGECEQALLDHYTVSFAVNRNVIALTRERNQAAPGTEAPPTRMLAVVNPTGDLTFAGLEGAWIAGRFDPALQEMLDGPAATIENILERASGARYLHFACHGNFSWRDPHRSGLTLAGGQTLELSHVVRALNLRNTRLVVLSACSSGQIESSDAPEEFLGLQTAFLQAGAAAVLCSLWPVDDISTALLMDRFYECHLSGLPLAGALCEAQRWLRGVTAGSVIRTLSDRRANLAAPHAGLSGAWRHFLTSPADERPFAEPFYWAPFTLYGE